MKKTTLLTLITSMAILGLNGCGATKDITPQRGSKMTVSELCEHARRIPLFTDLSDPTSHRPISVRAPHIYSELVRRKAYSSKDLKAINRSLVGVGDSVKAMECVKGKPTTINYSSYGDAQYVYRSSYSSSYYYVNDYNIITAWN